MPQVFRTMWADDDLPRVGTSSNCLGVRVPSSDRPDVQPQNGVIGPGQGGLSVGPHWTKLPPHLIPSYLAHIVQDARGKPGLRCFRTGSGDFVEGPIHEQLRLTVDRAEHGTIQPLNPVTIEDFQQHLAATRELWTIDESHEPTSV